MRILAIADMDDFHWQHGTGRANLLLSCGDVSDQVILEAAAAYACSGIFAVKGNHDLNALFPPPIIDLHLHVEMLAGIRFGGLNGSWRYKPKGHFLYEQREVAEFLSALADVDVLVSHNSPRGIHDDREDEVHYGFDGLNTYITRAKPRVVVHGHQHVNKETRIEGTRVIGVYGYRLIAV